MRTIVVTRECDHQKIYLNPSLICAVYPHYRKEDVTIIQFAGADENYLKVMESSATVASMMDEELGRL